MLLWADTCIQMKPHYGRDKVVYRNILHLSLRIQGGLSPYTYEPYTMCQQSQVMTLIIRKLPQELLCRTVIYNKAKLNRQAGTLLHLQETVLVTTKCLTGWLGL